MFIYKYRFTCKYYEEHSGENYQGCWEFNDLCWASPELNSPANCDTRNCPLNFFSFNNEAKMLGTIFNAFNQKKEVWSFGSKPTSRPLTEVEKGYIIDTLNYAIEMFNFNNKENLPYG